MRAVEAARAGGPEVLRATELPDPQPGPGELLVDVAAAGVNFIDTYRRSGVYPMEFPHVPGSEGAGTVAAVGDGVSGVGVGDRVAWVEAPGSYAERVLVRAEVALPVPDGVDDETAAAVLLQGMTAHYLTASTFPVQAGQDVLVHAAAGGTGLLVTQLATARGGRVIGTVSTAGKEALAREAGAAEVIRYTELGDLGTDLPAAVRDRTGGAGVHVVYDGVGRDTFDASLASLRRRGMLVLFGGSSGQVPPVDLQRLNAGGSLFVTRPTLAHYAADAEERRWRASEVLGAVTAGDLRVRIGGRYPLADAARAHEDLQGRRTTGKLLLLPRA
ncbi:quinone oxidoreductase [Quadrisphaera sp. DSM 44207]|uniref:quinone oxidoreductase family protein n=1 Tax=Quadrisphaera sp. DSM 44207 TaxID=1881057 RepID=UPI00088ED5FB|nr:quinone oxidoreductase [Quadrisphaera sp. DSM 44207]SDQ43479.1 NADPH2:quinone reductase [Quadrisphaera sp. DSM 44207]